MANGTSATSKRNSSAVSGAEAPKGRKNVGSRGKSDAEVGFVDDVEVRKADGSVTTLGEIDPEPKAEAPKKAPAIKTSPVQKPTRSVGKAGAAVAERTAAQIAADKKAQAAIDRAQKETEKLRAENKALLDAQKKADKDKKEADRKAKADLKAQEKADRDAKKEADKKAKEEEKNRKIGETADPEFNAAFHAAQDRALALVAQPFDTRALNLDFLSVPGVVLSPLGLKLPDNLTIGDWTEATRGLHGLQDVAAFALGDDLLFGETHFGKAYDVITEELGIEKQRAKDLKWISRTFPVEDRLEGLTITHYQEVAGLYAKNQYEAMRILHTAATNEPRVHTVKWVRDEVKKVIEPTEAGPSKADRKAAEEDALVLASTDQREADLAEFETQDEVNLAEQRELHALYEYAQRNDVVPSEAALRNLRRLVAHVYYLEAEVNTWKAKYEAAQAKLDLRDQAQAAVLEGGSDGPYDEPVTEEAGAGEDVLEEGDLSFLDNQSGEGQES